ncbi:MAG TPA: hypothetical protein GXX14_11745 [Clostridiaceae bacterium]|nr:hypothetical protein [Clostridiaceae bacterium]
MKIVPPKNMSTPLQGKWEIVKCMSQEEGLIEKVEKDSWLNKYAQFKDSFAQVGNYSWDNVSYKIRVVDAHEYFLFKFKEPINKLGINGREIYVITLSADGNFLFEFVKVDENKVLADIDGEIYCLEKISDNVDENIISKVNSNKQQAIEEESKDEIIRTGLLLGIRTPEKTDSSDEGENYKYSYRTMWIAAENSKLHPVLEADGIYLPRKNGFWSIGLSRVQFDGIEEDILTSVSISSKSKVDKEKNEKDIISNYGANNEGLFTFSDFWSDKKGVLYKTIQFVGNDFICIETYGKGYYKDTKKEWQERKLMTIPVDNISRREGVKISDIAGENGTLAMETSINNLLSTSNVKKIKPIDIIDNERSFSLFRKTGHWVFKGRINFQPDDAIPFIDFNINLIPPADLVAYDTLHVKWTNIKDKVPRALDAYTSPNKDIAVVLTGNELLVYLINGDNLSDTPVKKLSLKEGDTVVMAEWARGSYMEKWENSFKKNNIIRNVD